MLFKRYRDFISGLFLLILSGLYISQIGTIKIIDSGSVDAAFIPKLIAGALLFLSVCMILSSVYTLKTGEIEEGDSEKTLWGPVVLTAALLLVYVALFERIGFLITTALYLFAQLLVLAPERNVKKTVQYAVSSVISAFILQYIFVHLLYVMLPEGLLR